jgi:hypothetical protein
MAELQMQTIGAPHVVTGTDYMDALSRLGWNKENMSSDLPTMTAVAGSLTSFMDKQYNQALNYQKTQADLAFSVAQTKHANAVTDQIQQELPYRIKQLDLDNKTSQNTLDYNTQTLDSRINQQKLTEKQLENNVNHQQKKFDLDDTQQSQNNQIAAIRLDDLKSQQQRDQDAVNDLPSALSDIPDPHDLNYVDELTNYYKNHANAATNPATKDPIQARLKNNDLIRSTLASYQEEVERGKKAMDYKVTGDIPDYLDTDSLKQDPEKYHQVMSRGAVTRANRQAQEILANVPRDPATFNALPAEVQKAISDLQEMQGYASNILTDPNGMNKVRSGDPAATFDTNGELNPRLKGEMQALQNYTQERIKQGLGKPVEGDVTLTAPVDPLNPTDKDRPKVTYHNVPLSQVQSIAQHPELYAPTSPQQQAALGKNPEVQLNQSIGQVLQQKPEIGALLERAKITNTPEDWKAYAEAVQANLPKPTPPPSNTAKPPPDQPHKGASSGNAANAEVQPVSFTPGSSSGAMEGRITPSNGANYIAPRGAADVAGIDANVWQNVMSEEGPEFDKDGSHNSVFGLWEDASAEHERNAYQEVRENGAHSLQAYNAVTHAWLNQFLGQSQPWRLSSPGLQEMVIADSQHSGGSPSREIIDRMGGWDAVNQMDPAQAIQTYSNLRRGLWVGNQRRVERERDWALRNNDVLSGQQATPMQASAMPMHESGHPMPRTPREALTLGPGKRFMAPDGTLREVPNNIPQYA